MNNGIAFLIGAAVGSAASYFIFKKKFQNEADQQIKEMRNKISEIKASKDILAEAKHKADENYNKPSIDSISVNQPEHYNTEQIDYSAISKKDRKSKKVSDEIRIISEHEYYDYIDKKKFDEKLFTFYQVDQKLIDEEMELAVNNPEFYVGPNGVDAMIGSTVEEIYFLDEINKTVYTVSISEDSYDEPESDEETVRIE